MYNIYGLTEGQLRKYFLGIGENPAKAGIIFEWLYKGKSPNIRDSLISKIKEDFSFYLPEIIMKSEDDTAIKYLFKLHDGNTAETVIMKHSYGLGICLSTQVGCNMGCAFCESGRIKKKRNLNTCEIVGQLIAVQQDTSVAVTHVVFMGIGEPFDNFDNSVNAVSIMANPHGLALGKRHITLSTCGIIPKIEELARLSVPACLAISLHAPNDTIRNSIMPINRKYPLSDLISSVKEYSAACNKRITFEYILLKGINCGIEHADQLIDLLGGIDCYVNLIPYNETEKSQFERCDTDELMRFYNRLKSGGLWVTIRREFGKDIKAACGQLKNEYEL